MTRIRVGDLSLDYELRGEARDGPPLLMLCGYRRNRSVWGEALLAPLAARFQLVLVDNRGTGNSDKPENGYSIDAFADDAAGLLAALEIPRAHVFGVSMGGMIVQNMGARHPERVAGLAIGCSSYGGPGSVPNNPESLALLRTLPDENTSPEKLAEMQLPAYFTDGYVATHREFLRDFFRMANENPTPNFAVKGHLGAIEGFDGSRVLDGIRAPTLVITGADDNLIPAENSRLLADRIRGAKLTLFPDSGHFFWVDHAAETAAALIEFFSGAEGN